MHVCACMWVHACGCVYCLRKIQAERNNARDLGTAEEAVIANLPVVGLKVKDKMDIDMAFTEMIVTCHLPLSFG